MKKVGPKDMHFLFGLNQSILYIYPRNKGDDEAEEEVEPAEVISTING